MSRCGPFMVLAVRRVPGRKTHCFWAYVIKLLNGFALFGRTHHPPRKTAQWQSQSEAVTVASCKKKTRIRAVGMLFWNDEDGSEREFGGFELDILVAHPR